MLTNKTFLLHKNPDHACLLLHGLGGGPYEMQLLGHALYEASYTVSALIYPGHEPITAKMPASTWQEWYTAVKNNYDQLKQKYGSVSVIGFSTGCPLALYLSSYYPIKNLVLLSPFLAIKRPWFSPFNPAVYLPLIGGFIKEVPRLKDVSAKLSSSGKNLGFETFNLSAVESALELISIVKGKLNQITVPTLIIQSPYDSVVEPDGASFIYSQLASEHKQLVWLEKSDHIITLDVERERVFEEVKQFLVQY